MEKDKSQGQEILDRLREANERIPEMLAEQRRSKQRITEATRIAQESIDQFDSLTLHQWEADGAPDHSEDYLDNIDTILTDHQDVTIYGTASAGVMGLMKHRFVLFRKHSLKARLLTLFSPKFREMTRQKEDAMANGVMFLVLLKFKQDMLARYEITEKGKANERSRTSNR